MTFKIQQTWWHIEEIYSPSKARKIRQVMDIFTSQSEIPVTIISAHFVGLRVFARNLNREIPFLENREEEEIILNLDPLKSFPLAPTSFTKSDEIFYHIKIEFEYVDIKPQTHSKKKKISFFQERSEVKINGHIQPEVYIYLPLGRRLTGNSIKRELVRIGKNKEGYNVGIQCKIKHNSDKKSIPLGQNDKFDQTKIIFNKPFINNNKGKRIYNYTITDDCYKNLLQKVNDKDNEDISYHLTFTSKIDFKILLISLIPLLLIFPISFYLIISKLFTGFSIFNSSILQDSNNSMPFLIIIMSSLFFYYSLIKEGYDLPFKQYYIIIFLISIIAFVLWAFYCPTQADASLILNNLNDSLIQSDLVNNS